MLTAPQVLGYALASFILIVIPGPNVLFIVGRALAHGRRAALATVAGNAIGSFVVAVCVAAGIECLRVHDVAECRQAAIIARAIGQEENRSKTK